jgi:uncharacterized protein (DUF885 family)
MSYLIGKREVMALAADYAQRHHAPTKRFHDDLLEWGCLPPSVIRWGLGLGGPPPAVAALRE